MLSHLREPLHVATLASAVPRGNAGEPCQAQGGSKTPKRWKSWENAMLKSILRISSQPGIATPRHAGRSVFVLIASSVFVGMAFTTGGFADEVHDAVRADDAARLVLLLESGAAVNETDFMLGTPLHIAVAAGNVPLAKILISHKADLEAPSEDRGARALHLAANFGDVEMLDFLLDAGADIEARDQRGQTPLLLAAATDNPEVVKVLIDRGADKEAREAEKGMTPLMRASRLGFLEVAVLLVESGVEINAVDSTGFSPLQLAATRTSYTTVGNGALIEYLVNNGADLNMKNPSGHTALSWATEATNHPVYHEIADVLRKLGATE